MSVEDIERNIRNQQKRQNQTPTMELGTRSQTPLQHQQQLLQLTNQQIPMQQFQRTPGGPPPGLPPTKGPLFPPHLPGLPQVNNVAGPKPAVRLPPGFPPMPLMGQHPLANGPITHHNNMPRPMPHNLPVALNNFAVSKTTNLFL